MSELTRWVNQTTLNSDPEKKRRVLLSDNFTDWNMYVDSYVPPLHEDVDRTLSLLSGRGVEVATLQDIINLGKLTTRQAVENYGPSVLGLRNPLGRTGIGGTGEFWQAGQANTADIAITRNVDGGRQVLLVESRGLLHLPGGFCRFGSDKGDRAKTAMRESAEETSVDVELLGIGEYLRPLTAVHVKARSSRSADCGYIVNQVFGLELPDPSMGDFARAGGDAKKAMWLFGTELDDAISKNAISPDHGIYAKLALAA